MIERSFRLEDSARLRASVLIAFVALLVGGLWLRLVELQVAQHGRYQSLARSQHWSATTLKAQRGAVYLQDLSAQTSFPVAISDRRSLVYAVPAQIKDRKGVAGSLAGILGVSASKVRDDFSLDPHYVIIRHKLDAVTAAKIKNARLPGVYLQDEPVRIYPEGRLASSVIGFTNADLVGQYGLERSFNTQLAGKDGSISAEQDPNGVPILSGGKIGQPSTDGSDIYLTIDRNIQQAAESALEASVKKFHAQTGSVAVMDPTTGKILAMADYPTYDPNSYASVRDYAAFENPAVDSPYEPGSIFKIITMAAGIDSGKITPETAFNETGKVEVGGHVIEDADHKAHGQVDMKTVLAKSLNVGTVYALGKMGNGTFYDYVKRFGFGVPTGVEFDNEATGQVGRPPNLSQLDYSTMTFGQGLSVTPIQMLVAAGALADGGKMVQPHIIQKVVSPLGKVESTKDRVVRQVVKPETAKTVSQMMVGVVDAGYGAPAALKGYTVAGKTGTAQIPRRDGKGYEEGSTIGSFVGYLPNHPNWVMITRLDRPQGVSFSEEPAAQLWKDVASFLVTYYGISPDRGGA